MAELTVIDSSTAGIDPEDVDQAADVAGDEFVNDGKTLFWMKNDDASQHTATIAVTQSVDSRTMAARTVDVPAGESRLIGAFPTSEFNDADRKVQVTYDAVTSVSVAAIRVG